MRGPGHALAHKLLQIQFRLWRDCQLPPRQMSQARRFEHGADNADRAGFLHQPGGGERIRWKQCNHRCAWISQADTNNKFHRRFDVRRCDFDGDKRRGGFSQCRLTAG